MDYRQTLLVLLSVLLCSSQGLTESTAEATLVHRPSETSTEAIPKSTPPENVSALLEMMNILNRQLNKTVIHHEEMNTRIITRLDEMNSTMMTRLDEMNTRIMTRLDEIDNKIKSLDISITNSSEINLNKYLTLSQDMKKFSTRLDEMEAPLQRQVLLCSSQGLTETPTETTLVQTPPETSARLQPQEVSSYGKEKQFVLMNGRKTWQGAYDDCIKRNMMLASIESKEENNKVGSLIKNLDRGTRFWLSGSDLDHTGRWVWKSTGRDVTYNQWDPLNTVVEPWSDGEVEHCMYVYSGNMLWYDERCSIPHHYICQH